MADDSSHRNLSLIPYNSSGEIVLRHGSAVVVYDPTSHQLMLRSSSLQHNPPDALDLTDCPYCHRPLNTPVSPSSPNEPTTPRAEAPRPGGGVEEFVNPHYFRMLHHSRPVSNASSRHTSPDRQLQGRVRGHSHLRVEGGFDSESEADDTLEPAVLRPPDGAEFVSSDPVPQSGGAKAHRISTSAFSQGYFKRFFVEERELGRGGKGVVLLVRHILDGVPLGNYACKRVPVGDDHEWLEKVLVEVQLLQDLSHQNLVSYRHVWLEDFQITRFGPSVPCAFILQQYCNLGDLHQYILDINKANMMTNDLKEQMRRRSKGQAETARPLYKRLAFDEIFKFFKDITSGLHHLHANNFIHRDLKPSNCLLHKENDGKIRVLVSDFGEMQVKGMERKSTGATGTISYCAPEVLRRDGPGGGFGNFTTKSDIFSLGMIVYFMCFGRLPYSNADDINEENEDIDQLRTEIQAWSGFDDQQHIRKDLPDRLYKFLKKLLSLNPQERPEADDILQGIARGSGLEDIGSFNQGGASKFLQEIKNRVTPASAPNTPPPKSNSLALPSKRPPLHQRPDARHQQVSPERKRRPISPLSDEVRAESADSDISPGSRSPLESSIVLRGRKSDQHPTHTAHEHPPHSPARLMLPPPPTIQSRLHTLTASPFTLPTVKTVVFLLKIYTLIQPCLPFSPRPAVLLPLAGLAALDIGFLRGWLLSIFLLGAHVLVLIAASQWGQMCLSFPGVWNSERDIQ